MRLSPVLLVAVTIAAPLSSVLSASAQTPNILEQTAKAAISDKTQDDDHEIVEVYPAKPLEQTVLETVIPTSITPEETPGVQETTSQKPIKGIQRLRNRLRASQKAPSMISSSRTGDVAATTTSNTDATAIATIATAQQTNFQSVSNAAPNTSSAASVLGGVIKLNHKKSFTAQAPEAAPQQTEQNQPEQNQPEPNQAEPNTVPQQEFNQQQAPTPGTPTAPSTTPEAAETRVLVSEVLVVPESGQLPKQLEDIVYKAIRTLPGRTTTRSQLQQDINAIFATGFFANVQAKPEDTPLGVRVSFVVRPNPVLTKVQIEANPGTGVASVLPPSTVDEIFKSQYGNILNLRDLQEGITALTKRYQEQGFVLANVIGAPSVSDQGVVTLRVAEGVVEDIRVRFRNKEGEDVDSKGQPIRGRTRTFIITREMQLKSGQIFNRNIVQKDLQRVFGLGLFEDLNISLEPGQDASKVDVIVNVVERNSGSIAAGAGISSASGLFGTVSYQEQNLGGNNQKLGAELQLGVREFLFDLRFTDPWIAGDPFRTSYTVNAFRRRSISLIFEGKDRDILTLDPNDPNPNADNGSRPRIVRTGGGINFTRPLTANPFENPEWVASAGLQYQRVDVNDADGNNRRQGKVQGLSVPGGVLDLTQSGGGADDLVLVQLGLARDRRNNPLQPSSGSFFRLGLDQSIPVGSGSIFLTRLRGSYSQYFPVKFTGFGKGPETLAFNVQAGTVLGDLPIYEAFSLGGSNSVRGYEEGALASSRSFLQATMEYRFPLISIVNGALFFDVGTDFGSGNRASQLLNKNGTGYGYGVGVRVNSPLGPIRVDWGFNDEGDNRINFGIGERF